MTESSFFLKLSHLWCCGPKHLSLCPLCLRRRPGAGGSPSARGEGEPKPLSAKKQLSAPAQGRVRHRDTLPPAGHIQHYSTDMEPHFHPGLNVFLWISGTAQKPVLSTGDVKIKSEKHIMIERRPRSSVLSFLNKLSPNIIIMLPL